MLIIYRPNSIEKHMPLTTEASEQIFTLIENSKKATYEFTPDILRLLYDDLKGCKEITDIDFSYCNLKDNGAIKTLIDAISQNQTLQRINLSNTGLTDEHVLALARAIQYQELVTEVIIDGDGISKDALSTLQHIISFNGLPEFPPSDSIIEEAPIIDKTIISYKVEDDLWFSFAPITGANIKYYDQDNWKSEHDVKIDISGFVPFFTAIDLYMSMASEDPNVHLYAFLATQKPFKGGSPLDAELEMAWSVTIDERCKFSSHMEAHKYDLENPHKAISVPGHAFCRAMTQMLFPEVPLMIFAPIPIMRSFIWQAMKKKGLEDGIGVIVDEDKSFCDTNYAFIDFNYIANPDLLMLLNKYIKEDYGTISRTKHYQQLAIRDLVEMICLQEDPLFAKVHGKEIYRSPDGTRIDIEGGMPAWVKHNVYNNEWQDATDRTRTIINLEKLASLFELAPEQLIHTKEDVEAMGIAAMLCDSE